MYSTEIKYSVSKKPDRCDLYDTTSPIHNVHSLFFWHRETSFNFQFTELKVFKLA